MSERIPPEEEVTGAAGGKELTVDEKHALHKRAADINAELGSLQVQDLDDPGNPARRAKALKLLEEQKQIETQLKGA